MATFTWRGILQTLFEADDSELGDSASPLASARTPRWSRNSAASSRSSRSPSPSSPSSPSLTSSRSGRGDDALPYSPSRLDGEFNVWFARKPLGLGLVPSTQLYGSWEISSIAPTPTSTSKPASPVTSRRSLSNHEGNRDEAQERKQISHGDVIIAVNFSTKHAQLPRDKFMAYLQKSTCPIVMTLRRPTVYGSFDSRALSTAMFPTSIEYRDHHEHEGKTFFARAPSIQWKRNLHHELSKKNKSNSKNRTANSSSTTATTATDIPEPTPPPTALPEPTSSAALLPLVQTQVPLASPRRRGSSGAELTPLGEYTHIFHTLPLHLVLAPSTRLYGSVEVYDPKQQAPVVQIGDVVMAVNGDSSVAKWPTDEAIDHIAQLEAPVTITFRRPAAYRRYLETYFKSTTAKMSSRSTATAMFPDSAEYKHGGAHGSAKSKMAKKSQRTRRGSMDDKKKSTTTTTTTATTIATTATAPSPVQGQGKMTKDEWQRVSSQLSTSDQFTLWHSGSGQQSTSSKNKKPSAAGPASAFLTERHVHYLWSHLPEYLTCNDMELVYDTRRHGWNTLSFYARVQDKGPTLLVIKDTRDQIFGVFSSTSWKHTTDVYGNGRCFAFTLRPQMKVYTWSGLEDTFMYGRRDAIMMGGGKKGIALCVQLDELRGFSKACETFDSPPLAPGNNGNFDMENMEVWCFSGLRV